MGRDWHEYRVQRSKLKKLTGVDYQNSDYSKHQSSDEIPPVVITLQELRDKLAMEDRLKLIRQTIITDRETLDDVTKTGDPLKIKTIQDQLVKDFSEYKAQKSLLKALESQMSSGAGGSKKNGHKHANSENM